jgi:hypothetical protein
MESNNINDNANTNINNNTKKSINITFNNFEQLIKEKKIDFEDLKTQLNLEKIKNIYYEMVICSYFGYPKYIELVNFFIEQHTS